MRGPGSAVGIVYPAAGSATWAIDTAVSGDKYTGMDRFGRLVETRWKKGADFLVHSHDARKRLDGVAWRGDDKAPAPSTEDNCFRYGVLYQVKQHRRGELNAYNTGLNPTPAQNEVFQYDEMGNWLAYQNSSFAPAQTRSHNKANEITSISGSATPEYDALSNMTKMPLPADWADQHALLARGVAQVLTNHEISHVSSLDGLNIRRFCLDDCPRPRHLLAPWLRYSRSERGAC